jgi:hypothetical protein
MGGKGRRGTVIGSARGRTFTCQELLEHRLEFGYPGRGDVPDLVEVHSDVIVNQDVPHPADRLPIE